jgi:multiple sugar transport system permease protein
LLNVSIISLIWMWLMDSDFGILLVFFERLGWRAPSFLNDEAWVIPAIAIATAWWLMGYRMVIFQAALRDIPPSILEMAEIDGASPGRRPSTSCCR